MNDTVIRAENLGKLYHIGENLPYQTLREDITNIFANLFKKLKTGFKSKDKNPTYIWALRNVSFEVKKGEVVGFIGRNGAGKSTLLKILSCITSPTEGYAQVRGQVASLLEVGTGFHPELTGRDNIYLNGAIMGMKKSEIKRKFDEIVNFAEVEKFIYTPVKYYSSGMYVRLAFAVAAHLESEILLVDEVLAVGDVAFQKKCLGKMGDVTKEGRTVLFVSHNMAAVNRLCNWAIWLDKGRIEKMGPTERIVVDYLSVGAGAEGKREWSNLKEAPGNECVRLRAARILNSDNKVISMLDQRLHFFIEIEYEVFFTLSDMQVGFHLLTSDGVIVFVSGDKEDREWLNKTRPPGRYISRCKIPGMLLNSGTYILNAGVNFITEGAVFMEENVLQLHIAQTETLIHSSHSGWKQPGILALNLEWHISKTERP